MTTSLAGRIISGHPTAPSELASWIDTANPDQLRAALNRLAELAVGIVPHQSGVLVLAEAEVESGQTAGAYEWYDDEDFGGWYDVTGAENLPQSLDEIRHPDGPSARIIDGHWLHNAAIVEAITGDMP